MSEFFGNFHFLRPWWLLALAALPLLWLGLARRSDDAGAWRGAVDAHLLTHLLDTDDAASPSRRLPRWLLALAWLIACLALAGPAWQRLPQPLYEDRAARVFALELAPSMAAQDLKPSRYERARFKLDDMLARSGGMQTALIGYSADAFVVAPLTDDTHTVSNLVDALDPGVMPAPGNDTGRAIDLGVKLIRQAGLRGGQIVLLADSVSADGMAAVRRARAARVRVSVLGVGTDQGVPVALLQGGFLKDASGNIVLPKLETSALAALAQAGGGTYAGITPGASDIDTVLDATAPQLRAQASAVQATTARFLDRGPWLVLLLLPLAALGFRRGWLMLLPLVLLAHTAPAQAFSWRDLWQTPDQQARAQLDAGHARQALALARDPALRGAAAYRADDYAAAAQDFSLRDDAQALYNRGNALAKQQKYEDAIAAYDAALRRDPNLADAAVNKKTIEDWLKQKQQQRNRQQQQNQNQQKDSKQRDSSGQSGSSQQDEAKNQPQDAAKSAAQDHEQNHQQPGQQEKNAAPPQSGKPDDTAQPPSARAQAQAQKSEHEAQKKFSLDMSHALQQQGEKPEQPKPVRLGARTSDAPQNERDQAVEQWLQRVPDDPGGLLRRKFQLEYQMRQQGGSSPQDEGE